MDTRGAHPNTDVDTIIWDQAAKKRISIRPFFTETADNGPTMKAMLQGRHRLAEDRKEEAGFQRDRDGRMVQGRRAETAEDRRGDAGAFDRRPAKAPA